MPDPDFEPLPPTQEDPDFEPLPAADPDFEPLPSAQAQLEDDDNQLKVLFNLSLRGTPEKKASVLKLAGELQAPTDVVESNFEALQRTWEAAKFDPARWRSDNPGLHKVLKVRPELGQVAMRDQKLSAFSRAVNYIFDTITDAGLVGRKSPAEEEFKTKLEKDRAARDAPQKVAVVEDAKAQLVRDDPSQHVMIPLYRAMETAQHLDASLAGYDLLLERSKPTPDAAREYELQKKVLDTKRLAFRRDYQEGETGQFFTDVAEGGVSMGYVLKDAGIGAGLGFLGGGALGALITKTPQGATAMGARGAALLGRGSAALGTFKLEAGSAYLDLLDAKTDDDKPLGDPEARGAAAVYGALAAGIEFAQWGFMLKQLGPAGDILRTGTLAPLKELALRDAGFRAVLARSAKAIAAGGLSEAGEEGLQTALQDAVAYFAKSYSQGRFSPQEEVSRTKTTEAMSKAFAPGVAFGAFGAAVQVATDRLVEKQNDERSDKGDQVVAAVAGAADTPTAEAAPEAVAAVVEEATARDGAPVTHFYIATDEFLRLYQGEAPGKAEQLLGPDGPRLLQGAAAAGEKFLEVPVGAFVKGLKSVEGLEQLVDATTTNPAFRTKREKAALGEALEAQAQQVAEVVAAESPQTSAVEEPTVANESDAVIEQMLVDLRESKLYSADEIKVFETFWRSSAEANPEFFRNMAVEVRPTFDDASFDFEAPAEEHAEARAVVEGMKPGPVKTEAEAWLAYGEKRGPRPVVSDEVKKRLAAVGFWPEQEGIFPYEESGRSMERSSGTHTKKGAEPEELQRLRMYEKGVANTYAGSTPLKYQQSEAERAELQAARAEFEGLPPEERAAKLFRHEDTGLYNRRGFETLPRPADRPFLAEWEVEGAKSINDHLGHGTLDAALRVLAGELLAEVPDAVKDQVSLRGWVRDDKHAAAVAVRMEKAISAIAGKTVRVTSAVTKPTEKLGDSFAAVETAHRDFKRGEVKAGRMGHRKAPPAAFSTKEIQDLDLDKKEVSDDPKVKAMIAEATKKGMAGFAEDLKKVGKAERSAAITDAHLATLGPKDFDTYAYQPNGLLTEEGVREVEKRLKPDLYGSADMRELNATNGAFTKPGANEILFFLARALGKMNKGQVFIGNPHGDEYVIIAKGIDKETLGRRLAAIRRVTNKTIFFRDLGLDAEGKHLGVAVQRGVHFAHGLGKTFEEADRVDLPERKKRQGAVEGPRVRSLREFDREAAEARRRGFELRDVGSAIREGLAGGVGETGSRRGSSEPQVAQVDTPAFKAWFKDSKVVDSKGRPLVVFHGTKESFDSFDPEKIGDNFRADEKGFFFTTDPKSASQYASGDTVGLRGDMPGANVMPVYVSLQKPLVVDDVFLKAEGMDPIGVREDTISFWDNFQGFLLEKAAEAKADGIILVDNTYKPNGEPTKLVVAFKPRQIKSATGNRGTFNPRSPNILFQEEDDTADEPRGYTEIRVAPSGRKVYRMGLGEKRDVSTFLHESGHIFLEQWADAVEAGGATARQVRDFKTLLDWFGVENRAGIKREHHEKFARGVEVFLFEGKAPSLRLQGVFQRFKLWLRKIYSRPSALNVELSPEVRDVLGRLFAAEDEVKRARDAAGLHPAFRSAEEMGVTPEEFDAYLDAQEEAAAQAVRAAEFRALKDRLRHTEAWWKKEESAERAKAREEYKELPAKRALDTLRAGAKLDRAAAEAMVGKDVAKRLPLAKGGANPDDAAVVLGYPTGEALVKALAELPDAQTWAENTAAVRMAEKHPDVLDERTELRALAQKGVHGDYTLKWLLKEWAALRKRAGLRPVAVDALERAAEILVDRQAIGRLEVGQMLRAERTASEKKAVAAAKGNYALAAVHTERQLLNFFRFRALTEARARRDSFLNLADELSTASAAARMGKASPVYRDGVAGVLEGLGLKEAEEREQAYAVGDVAKQLEADGLSVLFDVAALGRALEQKKDWRELSVSEMRQVHTALKQVKAATAERNKAMAFGKKLDKELVVEQLVAEARANAKSWGPRDLENLSRWQRIRRGTSSFFASTWRPENVLVEGLGGDNLKSMWHGAVFKPLIDAASSEAELQAKFAQPIIEAIEKMPAKLRRRLDEPIDGTALFPDHVEGLEGNVLPPSTRGQLLAMFLHAGTESSRQRLFEGRGISPEQFRQAVDSHLTKEDLDFAQSVWDSLEAMGKLAFELEERVSGIAPPKLKALPVQTGHGTYRGGYFPAVYTSDETAGQRQQANEVASLLDTSFTRPGTAHSHLKRRSEDFSGILSLNLSIIPRHVAQVLHDVAFREAIMSAGGLVLDPRVQAVMRDRLGEPVAATVLQWLKDAGQMRGQEGTQTAAGYIRFLRWLKGNQVYAVIGYSVPTFLGDVSAVLQAVPRTDLKTRFWASGLAETLTHPEATAAAVEAKSKALSARRGSIQRDLERQIQDLGKPASRAPLRWVKDNAFAIAEGVDKYVSTAIWQGRYLQGLADGQTETDAIEAADAVVRRVLPTHNVVEMSALLRDKGLLGALTIFQGYFNTHWNSNAAILRSLTRPGEKLTPALLAKVAGRLLAYGIAGTVVAELFTGRGPEEDEDWGQWFTRKLLLGTLASVPFVGNEAAYLVERKALDKQANQRGQGIAAVTASVVDAIANLADEDVDPSRQLEAALRAVGVLTGLPVNQARRTGGYLLGDESARDPFDFAEGVIYGRREGQPTTPLGAASDLVSGAH